MRGQLIFWTITVTDPLGAFSRLSMNIFMHFVFCIIIIIIIMIIIIIIIFFCSVALWNCFWGQQPKKLCLPITGVSFNSPIRLFGGIKCDHCSSLYAFTHLPCHSAPKQLLLSFVILSSKFSPTSLS